MPFGLEQYRAMATRLRSLQGRAIVSMNDHPAMREAFAGFAIATVDIKYTVNVDAPTERRELVIFSWDVHAGGGGLF